MSKKKRTKQPKEKYTVKQYKEAAKKTNPLLVLKKAVFDLYLDERLCPSCNKPIKDNYASSCPYCGTAVAVEKKKPTRAAKTGMFVCMDVIWGIVIILLFLILTKGLF